MEPIELLRRVATALEHLELRYAVTGSTATIFYGEPRFTADIDVVVELPPTAIPGLLHAFDGDEFYLDEDSVRDAVRRHGQFNLIHPSSGLKVDLIVVGESEFDRTRFRRTRRLSPDPTFEATFASPEDVILKKLVYFREGGSDKHLRDITGVVRVSGEELDWDYLAEWAERLEVEDVWRAVRERVGR